MPARLADGVAVAMRDRDNRTRAGAKDPWGSEAVPRAQRHAEARLDLDSEPGHQAVAEACEGSMQTDWGGVYAGSRLERQTIREGAT